MAKEILNTPEWKEYNDIVLDVVGFYLGWNNFEESLGPKQRAEVIDLNVATEGRGLVFYGRREVRNFAEELLRRIKFNPRIPQPEKNYLEAKLNASLTYLAALNGHRHDFHHYVYETLHVWPRPFEEGEILNAKRAVLENLHFLGYDGDFITAIRTFWSENLLNEEEIVNGMNTAAEKFLPFIKAYTMIDVNPMYQVVPVHINAPWRAWLRTEGGEIVLEINLAHPEGWVRGAEERIGLHEVPIHGGQIASWRRSSELGIISPASCVTTLHTPEQISTEGLATILPHINPELFPLSPYGELAMKLDYLERLVLHNAHIRANLLTPLATSREKLAVIRYVAEHLPYMRHKDISDRLKRRLESPLDRGYELSYSEGSRLHLELFEQLGRRQDLFRLLVREEFIRPMTAKQIINFAEEIRSKASGMNP